MNLQGVVSNTSLEELLTCLAKERRQGVLKLHLGEAPLEIFFEQGKIFEIASHAVRPEAEVLAWLHQSGLIPDTFSSQAETYEALYVDFSPVFISEDRESHYRRVISARIREKFHSLSLPQDIPYLFSPERVVPEEGYSPLFSVSQLLLERAEFLEDLSQRKEEFPGDGVFVADTDKKVDLTDVSRAVFSALDGITPLSAVPFLAGSCRFDVYRTLETLRDADALMLVSQGSGVEALDLGVLDNLDELFDESLETDPSALQSSHVPQMNQERPKAQSTNEPPTEEVLPTPHAPQVSTAQIYNGRLLSSVLVPKLLSYLIVLATVLLPLLLWDSVWTTF